MGEGGSRLGDLLSVTAGVLVKIPLTQTLPPRPPPHDPPHTRGSPASQCTAWSAAGTHNSVSTFKVWTPSPPSAQIRSAWGAILDSNWGPRLHWPKSVPRVSVALTSSPLPTIMRDVGALLTLTVGGVPVYVTWRSGADVGWARPGPFRIVKAKLSSQRDRIVRWLISAPVAGEPFPRSILPVTFTASRDGVIRPHARPRLRGGPGGALHPARWRWLGGHEPCGRGAAARAGRAEGAGVLR
jgi:hypothetical protein